LPSSTPAVAREGRSPSALIHEAITSYLSKDRETEIARRILGAYTRHPQEVLLRAGEAAWAMVAAELCEERPG
jgi:hypothetical protein